MHCMTFLNEYENLPIVLKSKKALKLYCFNYYTKPRIEPCEVFFTQNFALSKIIPIFAVPIRF